MTLEANPKGYSNAELAALVRKWAQRCARLEATDNQKHIKKLKKSWLKLEGKYNQLLKEAADEIDGSEQIIADLQSVIGKLKRGEPIDE